MRQENLFQSIVTASDGSTVNVDDQFPFYPLDAPGMPLPGPNFVAAARALGDPEPTYDGKGASKRLTQYGPFLHYLYRRALYDETFELPVDVKGTAIQAPFVPGHIFADPTQGMNGGPAPAPVMVIGKNPGWEEVQERANFVGPTSSVFFEALDQIGLGPAERAEWYVTNLVKWPQLNRQSDSIPQAWVRDCMPLLHEELRLVRPQYILCLGSDASKALLGSQYGVQAMTGRVMELCIPLHDHGAAPRYHVCKVMTALHPAAVFRTTELFGDFLAQLRLFVQLTHGADVGGKERDTKHVVIYTHRHLKQVVDEIIADPNPSRRLIAVDCEWHGEHPWEPGAYLRTIQFSTAEKEAYCVVLRHQGGAPAFQPGIDYAIRELCRLLKRDPEKGYYPRPGGWFFRADLPWLIHAGIDIREEYAPAESPEKCRTEGGWEASLAYHAVFESASYKLEDVAMRLTSCPRWDTALQQWRRQYCYARKLKDAELGGYGMCPDWVLHPYALYDVDAARRIAVRCFQPDGLLDRDWYGNDSWTPYWIAHSASLAFLEMEMNGILLDKQRVDELTNQYMFVRDKLLEDFRRQIRWPTFNPRSQPQCIALLFGDEYVNKRDRETGRLVQIRPDGAVSLGLTPIKTTGRRSRLWADVVARGEAGQYSPSTDKETLGILGHEHPLAMRLRDLKFISQILTSVLRTPVKGDTDDMFLTDEDGNRVYDDGLPGSVMSDGRVHTHLFQTKETGRAASARPALQNLSKRREDDYGRILGIIDKDGTPKGDYLDVFGVPLYQHPIRSILRASPGHVLVECDYTGAELAVIAWLSGDPVMIEHVRRNALPEEHPDFFDMHSQTAVRVFQLRCAPTKKGLKDAGYKGMRVAAKNVNFGIPYGRSAEAISRQCREEGVEISVDDTQAIIDYYFQTYQRTAAFLAECRRRSQEERWLANPYRRLRRFIGTRDRGVIGEQERQAQNFPIQSAVADAISVALRNFLRFRKEQPEVTFRLLLQIHDALLFEVPYAHVPAFVRDELDAAGNIVRPSVLRRCMVDEVPLQPCYLDGSPMSSGPYHFAIDTELCINWGEQLPKAVRDQLLEHGVLSC